MIDISRIVISEDITLREYQKESKEKIYSLWKNHQSVMLQMPTGTGKTRIFASIVKDLHNTSVHLGIAIKVLLLAHRDELIEQISENVGRRYNVRHGIIKSSLLEEPHLPTQIASIFSLIRRLDKWSQKQFDVIIIDEAHHAVADSYKKICNAFPQAKILGVTATPYRLSGAGFKHVFEQLIISPSVLEFIRNGFLCDYDYYSVRSDSDIQKLVNDIKEFDFDGDYAENALSKRFDNPKIRAKLLDTYRKYANGKKGIIYTININHNNHVCALLNSEGIKAKAIDSFTKSAHRKEIVAEFRKGQIDVLCNVNIFSEGFDCPDVEFIQLARPTKSHALYLQQVGRGFRKTDDKDKVIILDNVGLYNKFGLPSEEIDWNKYFAGNGGTETRVKENSKSSKEVFFIEEGDEEVIKISTTATEEQISSQYKIVEDFPLITLKRSFDESNLWYTYIAPSEYSEVLNSFGEPDDDDDDLVLYNHLKKICQDGKWGVYDTNQDKILIEPAFDEIVEGDIHGRSMVRKNGKYGLMNPLTGDIIISADYNEIEKIPYFDYIDKFIVRKEDKYGFIGKGNEILIPFEFDEIFQWNNGEFTFALNNDNWSIYDRKFRIVAIDSLSKSRLFFDRYYAVSQNDSYGFVDAKTQKMIIPLLFEEEMEICHDNFLMVKSNGNFGLLNNELEWIVYPFTQSIEFLTKEKLKVKKDGKYGVLLTNGEEVLPFEYSSIEPLDDEFIVYQMNVWKMIENGKEVFSSNKRKTVLAWHRQNQNAVNHKNQDTRKPKNKKKRRKIVRQFDAINPDLTDIGIIEKKREVLPVFNNDEILKYVIEIQESNKNGIRLNVVARELNYSKDRVIGILKGYGIKIPNNPNYKLSPREYAIVKIIKEKG
ncbi:MAG: DEAD/DEAH box helicase [Sphingobacteriia bacterium]|nr:DEAD/DEAH box helicase [Sphingobacteriia bacterium]